MSTLIKNAQIINENHIFEADVYIQDGLIHTIGKNLTQIADNVIDAKGKYLLPGIIDDQVHFREPGLTHKGDLYSESRAAVAGGVTTFMEMPNTIPATLTQELLQAKYDRAGEVSPANYSFFIGASNDNLAEVMKTDPKNVCGIKIFMGSSTGNMLVDNELVLEKIFQHANMLIATHCEDEATIRQNLEDYKTQYGEAITAEMHPLIRSVEACYLSSSKAVALAKKFGTRLHILHISTEKELALFDNTLPLEQKKITAEACVHHLYFSDEDYKDLGLWIKWNPAVKTEQDRAEIRKAVIDNRIDIIATDHAPHTKEEKQQNYLQAPSGGPLIQHTLNAMLEMYKEGIFSLEKIVEKMCHHPAICFQIHKRGFIREGYFADLVLVDLEKSSTVSVDNILYKCKWSPFEGKTFHSSIEKTWVNGNLVWNEGQVVEGTRGMRLAFDR
jgi:dihydroorotase